MQKCNHCGGTVIKEGDEVKCMMCARPVAPVNVLDIPKKSPGHKV